MSGVTTKIVIGVAAVAVAGAVYFLTQGKTATTAEEVLPEGATHTVVLTESGYEPKSLTVKRGDVVTFTTDRAYEHWPASNLHPTHNVYAAFDPKRPLGPSEEWSFQFTRVGQWQFHDHLKSIYTGDITVTE